VASIFSKSKSPATAANSTFSAGSKFSSNTHFASGDSNHAKTIAGNLDGSDSVYKRDSECQDASEVSERPSSKRRRSAEEWQLQLEEALQAGGKAKRLKKLHQAPQVSGWHVFCAVVRPALHKTKPKPKFKEVAAMVAEKWKALSPSDKQVFVSFFMTLFCLNFN